MGGTVASRISQTMTAGMDLTMICNANFKDRKDALNACPFITRETAQKLKYAEEQRIEHKKNDNKDARRA